jgi:BarA-like signal transduction histidine kinase
MQFNENFLASLKSNSNAAQVDNIILHYSPLRVTDRTQFSRRVAGLSSVILRT